MHWNQCSRNGCIWSCILHLGEKRPLWSLRQKTLLANYPTNIGMLPPGSCLVSLILPLSHPSKLCHWALQMSVQRSFFHLWEGWLPSANPVVSCKVSHDQNPTNFCLPVKSILGNNLRTLPGWEAFSSHSSSRSQEGSRVPWGVGLVCILDNMVIILFL